MTLGPIIWGLIGAFIGYWIGVGIYFFINKGKSSSPLLHEVTVIIQCKEEQFLHISNLLWKYEPLSIGHHPQ
ncbi:hypothetical protein WMO40_14040 [Bacillaceae bacterium CLA-AA-H227]|uniref:Uncharacterized protein n=1 Tax=Robertmurraya yapensis (ex Hitch et al 2024) TaxID=3133160 RepID=A0ACC6SCR0_9BACI